MGKFLILLFSKVASCTQVFIVYTWAFPKVAVFDNRKYKVIIYKTLIKPVLMYGAESWVLSKAEELRLGVFERKILRRIYGPICEGVTWRSRYNEELYRLYDETDLVKTIRIARLRWGGHIVRMQDNLPCKNNRLGQAGGPKVSGKAQPQMDRRSDEGYREAGS